MIKKKQKGLLVSFIIVSMFHAKIHAQTKIVSLQPKSSTESLENDAWSVYLKGFIQTDMMLDFQDMGYKDGLSAPSITLPQRNEISSNFSVKQSQIGLGIKQFSSNGVTSDLSAYVEIDFFGSNGTTAPRFRMGYIQWKNVLIGQTWSNFSDIDIFPNIFDFAGPNGTLFTRTMQVRYTASLSQKEKLFVSLEDPAGTSILLPPTSTNWKKKAIIPLITAVYRYGNERDYLKLGGILSPISYEAHNHISDTQDTHTILGFGGMISGKLYSSLLNNFRLQASYGKGYANSNLVLNGERYDAVPDIENNTMKTLSLLNLVGIYEHWWTQKWSSVVYYSYSQVGRKSIIPNQLIQNFQNAGANIIFQPYKKLRLGAEANYGKSENFAKESAHAFRIQLSTSLSF